MMMFFMGRPETGNKWDAIVPFGRCKEQPLPQGWPVSSALHRPAAANPSPSGRPGEGLCIAHVDCDRPVNVLAGGSRATRADR